jgi:23S rRNA pseudouridine2605 synthase
LILEKLTDNSAKWRVTMQEGRNRQIRRTFQALGYEVYRLHRTNFGNYSLGDLSPGKIAVVT